MHERAAELLPIELRERFLSLGRAPEEIRLRVGEKPSAVVAGEERSFAEQRVTAQELSELSERASSASLHTALSLLRRGCMEYKGLRVGLCGEVARSGAEITGFRSFSSAAIRIPKECRGGMEELLPLLRESVLIISPPGGGKTTALRELVRGISERGERVALLDERNELAAMYAGKPSFAVGRCTDILTGADKRSGTEMLLRALNPQWLAMDEITQPQDAESVLEAVGCGVKLIATAHAASSEDLKRREIYRRLLEHEAFSYLLCVSLLSGERVYRLTRLRT